MNGSYWLNVLVGERAAIVGFFSPQSLYLDASLAIPRAYFLYKLNELYFQLGAK